jgi:uncharacterized protein (DUF488 family)
MQQERRIWTIGHSTRTWQAFTELLMMHRIQLLVDIRAFPGSRRHPHFNKENLQVALPEVDILYMHMPGLGGRRKPGENSRNIAWRHPAFRAYADYMETTEFKKEIGILEDLAGGQNLNTAYMCSEAPWWKCHRALVSDYLKARGWVVWHIMEKGKLTEHPFTSPARPVQGQLFYNNEESP